VETALTLLLDGDGLPSDLYPALTAYAEDDSESHLRRVQRAAVGAGLWMLGPEFYTELVSRLVLDRQIDSYEAAYALCRVPYPQRDTLSSRARDLVEVASLVMEDEIEDRMRVEDDSIFLDAIRALLEES